MTGYPIILIKELEQLAGHLERLDSASGEAQLLREAVGEIRRLRRCGRVQWQKYGDHPAVRRPLEAHLQPCVGLKNCGLITTANGEELIREGDWIVTDEHGIVSIEPGHS
jgi:hypothetical protein